MLRLLLVVVLTIGGLVANAIPARKGLWKNARLADGTTVRVELKGDENLHYWQAADGKCYRLDAASNATLIMDISTLKTKARAKRAAKNIRRKARTRVAAPKRMAATYSGEKKGLIVLVEFADKKFATGHDKALYARIANEENFSHADGFVGSVKDYFKAQSNDTFSLDFDVVGPVRLSQKMEYYGADTDGEGDDIRPGAMVAEALRAVDKDVDFSLYDWNGDQEVDQVYILYAGYGQSSSEDANTIWPHEWALSGNDYQNTLTLDNVVLDTYACSNELNEEGKLDGIGTICHEFSHCLGLPDMYDTDDSNGVNFGMYSWDLMDYGGYNGNGFIPAGYTSYEKMFAGWLTPIELTSDTTITNMKALSENGDAYIIYNENNRNEYYLLENRQNKKWDAELPGKGMLILHVDYDENVWNNNEVNNDAKRQRCTIFHADDSDGTEDYDLMGDAYPYNDNDSLTNRSLPASILYNANRDGRKLMNKAIVGITQNADATMNFTLRRDSLRLNDVIRGDTLFYESFDQCKGSGGNDGKWSGSIAVSPFITDNEGWTSETDAAYGADQCAKFGTGRKFGIESSPNFLVVDGSVLTFKAAAWSAESTTLTIESDNSNVTLTPSSFTLNKGDWTNCEVKVQGTGAIKLVFIPSNRRFFLDEVLVLKPKDNTSTGIEEVNVGEIKEQEQRIYSLDGRYLGIDFSRLQKGIYIVNGKKVMK